MEEQLEYSIALERLSLENFRCFQDLNVTFDEKLTVFIAENGGGKTAILDVIAEGLKIFLATLKADGYKTQLLPFKDVKTGLSTARCQLLADIDYLVNDDYPATDNDGNPLKLFDEDGVIITDENGVEQIQIIESVTKENALVSLTFETTFNNLNHYKGFYKYAASLKRYSYTNLPVLVYYGGDSVHIEYNEKEITSFEKLDRVYNDALSSNRFQFTPFYNWWRHNEDLMLRIKNENSPRFKTFDSQFKKLKNAIEFMLNDNPLEPTYTDLRINDELKMGLEKNTYKDGQLDSSLFIEVSQFSAGEKSLFAFVADLGLRLLHATPLKKESQDVKKVEEEEGEKIIKGKGIVLIDEVDLHLHPQWQKNIVDKLIKIFPDVQFVMTTHSPLMLGGIESKVIRVLDKGKLFSVEDTYGREVDSILEIIMNVEAGKYTKEIKKIARLIAENDLVEAESSLQKMQKEIDDKGDDGAGHPDILRMNSLLIRKKVIGR
ncbi:MAG: AAA family ATPase [Saprospiraceae bacterium]|nr:AAA family ATPase [Saprospiraceae bacterium]